MRIRAKSLGVLEEASFELGDLTIICGENNTGKTYATYALYGFLRTWINIPQAYVSSEDIETLHKQGILDIDFQKQLRGIRERLNALCKKYIDFLPTVFAASTEKFKGTSFSIEVNDGEIPTAEGISFEEKIRVGDSASFSFLKEKGTRMMRVTLVSSGQENGIPESLSAEVVNNTIHAQIFRLIFPRPWIASAERTGVTIFRKELDFARNRLLEEMSKERKKSIDPMELLFKVYTDYAFPVKMNVEFIRKVEDISKKTSFIAKEHGSLLDKFTDIIGGEYIVKRNEGLYFRPRKEKVRLTMDESSSSVRSLLDVGFYLRHEARPRDLLMIDEPELNLHPENQRRMARLFARLVNIGVKVFITTHSDYIVKELNTLIMLSQDDPHLEEIAEKEGYTQEELISHEKVKVFVAEEKPMRIEGKKRKVRRNTLTAADISPETGIKLGSFDKTIDQMNEIQEKIIWQ